MERHYTDGTEPTVLPHWDRQSRYIPLGCDQQGRHPQAAESCTELGADDYVVSQRDLVKVLLVDLAIACCVVAAVALTLWSLLP